jgi:sugar lactone lactonase YvrE
VFSANYDHVVLRTGPDGGGITNELYEGPDAGYDPNGNDYYQGAIYSVIAHEGTGGGLLYKYQLDAGTGSIVARLPLSSIVSPNNIAISSRGTAYVTDPAFQFTVPQNQSTGVYQMNLDGGAVTQIAHDGQPVGIALNKDESRLYVSYYDGTVVYYTIANGVVSATPAASWTVKGGYKASGIAIDQAGNVWVAEQGSNGLIEVYNAAGTKVWATAYFPSGYLPNGIAFGGADRTKVFVTTENGGGQTPIFSFSTRCPGLQ